MKKLMLLLIVVIAALTLTFLPSCTNEGNSGGITPANTETNTNEFTEEETSITYTEGKSVVALVSLNVRSQPEIVSGNVVGVLNKYDTVELIAYLDNGWNMIEYAGETAYVSASSQYSEVIDSGSDLRSYQIESVIEAGMAVLATPYEYGSTRLLNYDGSVNPYFTGDTFDCSAFVQYSFYTGAGVILKGDSRSQSLEGELIDINDIKRGDLILMTSTDRQYNTGIERIGHVAIYLGDNQILHTYGTGGVRITDFNTFWRGRFILARRMI